MPFKDPERRREYCRVYARTRRLNPDFHKWQLEMSKVYDRKRYRRNQEERKLLSRLIWRRKQERRFAVRYPTWWLCDVCSKPISLFKGEINLDHDHTCCGDGCPKCFRGWLCAGCNGPIGRFEKFESQFRRYLRW